MSQPSDASSEGPDGLFARARAGDEAAWEELFRACYPKIVRVVRRKLNPPLRSLYDSTDFASDVWKSLAAKCDRFDFPSIDSLLAFLKKAAEQKVVDEYRRRHAQKRDIDRERALDATWGGDGDRGGAPGLPSPDPTPSQEVQAAERYEWLLARAGAAENRAVLDLKRQGYSNDEIAERTGWHVRKVQRFFKDLQDGVGPAGSPA